MTPQDLVAMGRGNPRTHGAYGGADARLNFDSIGNRRIPPRERGLDCGRSVVLLLGCRYLGYLGLLSCLCFGWTFVINPCVH